MQEAPDRDSTTAVRDSRQCIREHVSSYIQRAWTFVTQIKHAGDTGLSVDTFLAKPFPTCV